MKRHIGIDLGTTNCCVAWVTDGRVEVYENEFGHRTIPSIVAQDADGRIDVGWEAKVRTDPSYRHGFAKRAMGTEQLFPMRDGPVHAADISGYILKDLKRRAEERLGTEVDAVITIPAHFQQNQKDDTRRATAQAELDTIDLLTEPVAAAFAYYHSIDRAAGQRETALVYDLGGGTMDATVCVRDGDRIEVGAHGSAFDGDRFLGGLDFDKALVGLAAGQLSRQQFQCASLGDDLPRSSWLWSLLLSAEDCKHQLSKRPIVEWIEEVRDHERRARLQLVVTRKAFEQAIAPLIDKTLIVCDRAIRKFAASLPDGRNLAGHQDQLLRLGVSQLDRILLVGGSTLVPIVEQRVTEHYGALGGRSIPVLPFRPFEAVAIGAALYAASRPELTRDAMIEWLSPLDANVPAEASSIQDLAGRLPSACAGASVIELQIGGDTYRTEVSAAGVFRLRRIALQPGVNHLAFAWSDGAGHVLGRQAHDVTRGGTALGAVGLGRPISFRTRQGTEVLIPEGTPPDTPCQSNEFYVGDKSGLIRAPLFEGVYPIGPLELPVSAPIGTSVRLRCSYSSAGIIVVAKVGSHPDVDRRIDLQRSAYVGDRAALWERFVELRGQAERLIRALPQQIAMVESINDSYKALAMDIETEFANPLVLDPARIEDRLQQLHALIWTVEAFPTTREGFLQKVEELRRMIVDTGGDARLLKDLTVLEEDLPANASLEDILALTVRLQEIHTLFFRRHPLEITQDYLDYFTRTISSQLESIRRDGGEEQTVRQADERLRDITSSSSYSVEERFIKLHDLATEVGDVYGHVVTERQQQGLLSSVPPHA